MNNLFKGIFVIDTRKEDKMRLEEFLKKNAKKKSSKRK